MTMNTVFAGMPVKKGRFGGYPSYNGAVLFHHYQEPEKIRELIALGDGSFHQDQRGTVQAET